MLDCRNRGPARADRDRSDLSVEHGLARLFRPRYLLGMLKIRDIEIANGLALAPMEGVTDLTFRRLVRQIGGCGLTCTEFIPARGLAEQHKKVMEMVRFDVDESPVAIQVFGRDPVALAEGAKIAQDVGAHIVDLNMGCPSKRVCAHSGGSALMKEPDLVYDIVRAMRAAVEIPFTVKMRSGWDQNSKNAPDLAYMCQEEGAEAVTVHWRTREDNYGGQRELDTLAEVKRRLSIPVIANGDIVDVPSALSTQAYTQCDGWMIGRGAIKNPWVFRQIATALAGGTPVEPTIDEREKTLLDYYDALRNRFNSDHGALGRMKKIARYFTEGVHDGAKLRHLIFHSHTVEEAEENVREFFERQRQLVA
ncbi:MAG: tRNA-dihydrouridine synthase B [Myxococcota bacterium]